MQRKIKLIFYLLCLSLILLLSGITYLQINKNIIEDPSKVSVSIHPRLNSIIENYIFGYLGLFFRFAYFGNIIWLIIPLFIYFFIFRKNLREKWYLALVFVFISTIIILGFRGVWSFRYQFTLYPLAIGSIILLLGNFLKDKSKIVKIMTYGLLGILVVLNLMYFSADYYGYQFRQVMSLKSELYPSSIFEYVNNCENEVQEPVFLLYCTHHIFYYYSEKKAVSYNNPDFKLQTQKSINREDAYYYLKDELNVKYIISDWRFEQENKQTVMEEILNVDSRHLMSDKGYQLYQLREKPIEKILPFHSYHEWKGGALDAGSYDAFSSLKIQGIRGEFNFDYNTLEGKRTLYIRNIKEGENGERILQLGYSLGKDLIEKYYLRDNYVYFIVSVKLPFHLLNRQNYIFIQDYDGKWERVSKYFTDSGWRKYLVSKKIRPRSAELGIGFYFQLQSEEDEILIEDIQIYFSDHEI